MLIIALDLEKNSHFYLRFSSLLCYFLFSYVSLRNILKIGSYFLIKASVITVEPQHPDKPAFDIVAVVDPASQGAQKISTLLLVLKDVLNAKIRVFLNCVDKVTQTDKCLLLI